LHISQRDIWPDRSGRTITISYAGSPFRFLGEASFKGLTRLRVHEGSCSDGGPVLGGDVALDESPAYQAIGHHVLKEPSIAVWLCRACSGRTAHSNRSEISSSFLDPGTAQRSLAKEENREKDCRYRYRAYGRGLRDSIRKKNVARGFDPRIARGQFVDSRPQPSVGRAGGRR